MPPFHPIIVHYPIALSMTSVVADTTARLGGLPSLLPLGQWGMAIAAVGAVLAATAGYADMKRAGLAEETHVIVHLHMKIGLAVSTALVALALWRWLGQAPSALYLIVGWVVLAGVAIQAWLGGEIVYAHGGGVAAAGQGTAPAQEARQASRIFYNRLTGRNPAKESESKSHRPADGSR